MKERAQSPSRAIEWEPLPEALASATGNLLYWVADMGGRFYARALEPLGLRPPHVAALQLLNYDGHTPQARLGDKLRMDKKTTAYLLNDLEDLGLVARQPHPTDGRAFVIHLTEKGRSRLQEVERVSRQAHREFFGAALTEAEQHHLDDMLRRLASSNGPRPEQG